MRTGNKAVERRVEETAAEHSRRSWKLKKQCHQENNQISAIFVILCNFRKRFVYVVFMIMNENKYNKIFFLLKISECKNIFTDHVNFYNGNTYSSVCSKNNKDKSENTAYMGGYQ